jgi:hypothetical protein
MLIQPQTGPATHFSLGSCTCCGLRNSHFVRQRARASDKATITQVAAADAPLRQLNICVQTCRWLKLQGGCMRGEGVESYVVRKQGLDRIFSLSEKIA